MDLVQRNQTRPAGAQISGGHKYLPPRQDVNAPDLYIPLMAAGTYCLLTCLEAAQRHAFKPDLMTSAVRGFLKAHCESCSLRRATPQGPSEGMFLSPSNCLKPNKVDAIGAPVSGAA